MTPPYVICIDIPPRHAMTHTILSTPVLAIIRDAVERSSKRPLAEVLDEIMAREEVTISVGTGGHTDRPSRAPTRIKSVHCEKCNAIVAHEASHCWKCGRKVRR